MFNIKKKEHCFYVLSYTLVYKLVLIQGGNWEIDFLLFWKRDKVSCTIVVAIGIQSLALGKVFLLKYLLWHLLFQLLHCIESIRAIHKKNY